MSTAIIHEFRIRIAFTPRAARWLLPLFLCAAFPDPAGTWDEPLTANYAPSPAGVYSQITANSATFSADTFMVQGGGHVGIGTCTQTGSILTCNPLAAAVAVGGGVVNPGDLSAAGNLHVAGNLKVNGCIELQNKSKRCAWATQ